MGPMSVCPNFVSSYSVQHGMIWVGNAELPYNEEGINRLGSMTGVMAQAGQVSPELEPNEADRKTAERFGQRLAKATARWTKGS
jgi:NAD(P)H dehydrogenase (quinone)